VVVLGVPASGRAEPTAASADVTFAADVFGVPARPLAQAEVGGAYRVDAPPGVSLTAGAGVLQVDGLGPDAAATALLPSATGADVTVRHSFRPSSASAVATVVDSTLLRVQGDGDRYRVEVVVRDGAASALRLERVVGSTTTVVGRTDLDAPLAAGGWFRVEARVSGSGPVTLRARVWSSGQARPAWQVVAADTDPSAVRSSGAVGLAWRSSKPTGSVAVADLDATQQLAPSPGIPQLRTTTVDGFIHPGIANSAGSLSLARAAALAGRQPWAGALEIVRRSRFADPGWTPHPVAVVGCGAHNVPDQGCTAETDDAQAAYTQALLWYFTGDQRYARTAAAVLDAWSATVRTHAFDTTTYVNGRLQAAWAAQTFTKAAELLRASGADWKGADRFGDVLHRAFLPLVQDGWRGGGANGQLAMADATIAIGVYTNDRAVFDDGTGDWRQQLRAAVHLSSDGPQPSPPAGTVVRASGIDAYWRDPSAYVDGLEQETCRDAGHMALGLGAALEGAETAGLQGVDLYGLERERLVAGMEYNSEFLADPAAPGWVCPRPLTYGGDVWRLTWELGYRHYTAEGVPLPETARLLDAVRPTGSALFLNWETLTHGTAG